MTSTKCQYQAAASNPKWWLEVKWYLIRRRRQINRKEDPMMTCRPWKPVATKKVAPYTLSAMENGASWYSIVCRAVK